MSDMNQAGRDRLEWQKGGGCFLIIGIPFLAGGIIALGTALRLLPTEVMPAAPVASFVMGVIFISLGAFLIFAREKVVLDRRDDIVSRGWYCIVPLKLQKDRLSSLGRVLLKGDARKGHSSSNEFYSVAIERPLGGKDFPLEETAGYLVARRTAERVARFLKAPLSDSTSGREITRKPEHLDESYRDRSLRLGDLPALPAPPPAMRSIISEDADRLVIEIPPPGLGKSSLLVLVPPVVISLLIWYFFSGFRNLPMPLPVRVIFSGFFGIFILAALLSALKDLLVSALRSERLTLTGEMLRIERRRGLRWVSKEMPVQEIEELYVPEAPRLEGIPLPGGRLMLPDDFIQIEGRRNSSPGAPGRGIVIGRRTQQLLGWLMKIVPGSQITFLSDRSIESFGKGLRPEEMVYVSAKISRFIVRPMG